MMQSPQLFGNHGEYRVGIQHEHAAEVQVGGAARQDAAAGVAPDATGPGNNDQALPSHYRAGGSSSDADAGLVLGPGAVSAPDPAPQPILLSQLTPNQKTQILSALIREFPHEVSAAASKTLLVPPPGVRLYADDEVTGGFDETTAGGDFLSTTTTTTTTKAGVDGTLLGPPRLREAPSPRKRAPRPPAPAAAPAQASPTAAATVPAAGGGAGKRASWNEMLERMRAYKLANGDCRIPTKYPPDPPLGRWVDNQRQAYRRYHEGRGATWLTPERIALLEEAGFEWKVATYEFRAWSDWLEDLRNFREEHGHCRPITSQDAGASAHDSTVDNRLGCWCSHQREQYKRFVAGRKSQLTPERIEALDVLGFEWQTRPPVSHTFEDRIEQLAKFREENGHVNVLFTTKDGRRSLGAWVADMRTQYQKRLKGEKSSLSDERIARLTMLGFSFIKDYGPQRSWDVRFDELRKYAELNNHCNVTEEQDKTLCLWCRKQREGYRRMKKGLKEDVMTEERANRLDSIGFDFSARSRRGRPPKKSAETKEAEGADEAKVADAPDRKKEPKAPTLHRYARPAPPRWETKFAQLREFHAANGHCHVTPRNHSVALQRWCQRQREQYALWVEGKKNSTMSADKIRKLSMLDFNWHARPSGRPWNQDGPSDSQSSASKPDPAEDEAGAESTNPPTPNDANEEGENMHRGGKGATKKTQKKVGKANSDASAKGKASKSKASDTRKRKTLPSNVEAVEQKAKRAKVEKGADKEKRKRGRPPKLPPKSNDGGEAKSEEAE